MVRALVVGGTGFIGRRVVARLLDSAAEVSVVCRSQRDVSVAGVTQQYRGDRDDGPFLRAAIQAARPEVIIDLISYTADHARHVREAAAGACDRWLVVSSADVYRNYDGLRGRSSAPPDPAPLAEDAPLRETHFPYRGTDVTDRPWLPDYEKILVERVALGSQRPTATVVRLCKVYGPGDPQKHVGAYLERILSGPTVTMSRDHAAWRWTRGYVDDVAHAIVLAASSGALAGKIYNVGERDALTEAEWFDAIAAAAGRSLAIHHGVSGEGRSEADAELNWDYSLALDTSRIRNQLGFAELVGRREGVARTVAHLLTTHEPP